MGNGEKARASVNERLMEGGFVDARLGQCDKQTASAGAVYCVPALSLASSLGWRPGCDTVEVKNTTFLASSSSWVFPRHTASAFLCTPRCYTKHHTVFILLLWKGWKGAECFLTLLLFKKKKKKEFLQCQKATAGGEFNYGELYWELKSS